MGHSLDSDLRAVRLVHYRVLDTAALYPNTRGLPFKSSLKSLADQVLGIKIQQQQQQQQVAGDASTPNIAQLPLGHDSILDSAVALELVLVYLKKENCSQKSIISRYISPLKFPWISTDKFAHPKTLVLNTQSVKETKSNRKVFIFSNLPFSERSPAEQFLLGFRPEANPPEISKNYNENITKDDNIIVN